MKALSPLQRRYVIALFDKPGISKRGALRLAGYKHKDESCDRMVNRLTHNEKVKAALIEYGATAIHHEVPNAVGAINQIIANPKDNNARLKASLAVLDRAGLHAIQESHTTVTHTFDRNAVMARVMALLEKHKEALPLPTPLIEVKDAEFVEVKQDE